jgi:hypothetical protein
MSAIADALARKDALLDFKIPAAVKWIYCMGESLYAGAVNGEFSWAVRMKRRFEKENEKMNLGQWSFWEAPLEELVNSESTNDIAKAAARDMRVTILRSVDSRLSNLIKFV